MNEWQRPTTAPFPAIYRSFKGKKAMPDGRFPQFWVQDATDDMEDDIVEHMCLFFIRDEPMSRSLNFYQEVRQNEALTKIHNDHMRKMLKQRLTVVAMTDWPGGKPQLAGVNLLYYFRKGDENKLKIFPHETLKKFVRVMFITLEMTDVYTKYGVQDFTTAVGLSVHPTFRGQNIGVELLKARAQMTKAVGLKLTLNNFTGVASQTQAERAGYDLLAELTYPEVKDEDGKELFPGIQAKTLQFRAKYVGDKDEHELNL